MTAGLSLAPAVSWGPAAGQSISPVLLDNNINISHIFWPKFSANFPICVWRWTTSHAHCTGSFIQAEKIRDTAAGFWFTAEKCLLLLHINNQINCGSSAGGSWRKQCRVESRQVDIFSVLWECLQLSMSRSSGISSDIFPHFLHTIWIWSKLPRAGGQETLWRYCLRRLVSHFHHFSRYNLIFDTKFGGLGVVLDNFDIDFPFKNLHFAKLTFKCGDYTWDTMTLVNVNHGQAASWIFAN